MEHVVANLLFAFEYNPNTGDFIYRHGTRTGEPAGSLNDRSKCMGINLHGVRYNAAEVAWAMYHGEWPTQPVKRLFSTVAGTNSYNITNLYLKGPSGRGMTVRPESVPEPTKPSAAYLRGVTSYDERTGHLVWSRRGNGRKVGKPLGSLRADGHLVATIEQRQILVAKLVWLHVHGVLPHRVHFIDGDKTNTRIENLEAK